MRGVLGLGLRLGMGTGRGFAAVTRFIINLLTATSTRSTGTTGSVGGELTIFPANTPSFNEGDLQNYDAGTNRCECVKANPVDITGLVKSGDAAATLTVVTDSAELALAGLSNVCLGSVYKLDNSLGVGSAVAICLGASGVDPVVLSVYARTPTPGVITRIRLNNAAGMIENITSETYERWDNALTPLGGTDLWEIFSLAGGIVYFILPQMETSSITTPVMIGNPDTAAAVTRSADVTTVPTPSFVAQNGDWAFKFRGTPHQTAQALKALFSFDSNAINYTEIQLNAVNITADSVRSGASNGAAVGPYSHTVDVPFETNVYYVASTRTLGIRSDDVSGNISAVAFVEDVLITHPVITAVLSVGNRNELNQATCDFDNDGVPIFYLNKEAAGW